MERLSLSYNTRSFLKEAIELFNSDRVGKVYLTFYERRYNGKTTTLMLLMCLLFLGNPGIKLAVFTAHDYCSAVRIAQRILNRVFMAVPEYSGDMDSTATLKLGESKVTFYVSSRVHTLRGIKADHIFVDDADFTRSRTMADIIFPIIMLEGGCLFKTEQATTRRP